MKSLFLLAIAVFSKWHYCDGQGMSCYSDEADPYRFFGSKTAYDTVRDKTVSEVRYQGCQAIQIYFMARHGTRYPKDKEITLLRQSLPALKDNIMRSAGLKKVHICQQDLQNLDNWRFHINETYHYKLSTSGATEMKQLAMRYKVRFPSLLNGPYDPKDFDFRFTNTSRAEDSARNFAIGLFGQEGETILKPATPDDEMLLRNYKKCTKWQLEVNQNLTAHSEVKTFLGGPEVAALISSVGERVGLAGNISYETVTLMWDMCRFDAAWDPSKTSPWCALLNQDELKVLEYAEDLDFYAEDGYLHSINSEQMCLPLQDIINHFRRMMANQTSSEPIGLFRFTHSGFLLKLFTKLGLHKDAEPLLASNYDKQGQRLWRTSLIDPFSSNLALVVLDCENEGFKINALLQEKEITLPGCSSALCPMEEFLENFESYADNCDVKEICQNNINGGQTVFRLQFTYVVGISVILMIFSSKRSDIMM